MIKMARDDSGQSWPEREGEVIELAFLNQLAATIGQKATSVKSAQLIAIRLARSAFSATTHSM